MRVADFDFELPEGAIAQVPAEPRESARLLHVADELADLHVADLPDLLEPRDLLVLNDTAVLPTRFFGSRGEVAVEVTLIRPEGGDAWWGLARPGKRLRVGDWVRLASGLDAQVLDKDPEGPILFRFTTDGAELIRRIKAEGRMPLPPYIRRARGGDLDDHRAYQTVFARHDGSVAAPTASLHLTQALLERIRARGVASEFVTLHVGAGTFLPVKADDTDDHVMHPEWMELRPEAAARIQAHRQAGGRVVAVGSTALRTLETMARPDGTLGHGTVETRLFVTPGYRFGVVDRMLTNFHLPKSTLFMLVCAFAGMERMKRAYAHAAATGYRFFSYGDASLLERNQD
ncbi:tRNA preQ1(34) S-adenosylmethionine ribosyltransferase-isomerase QueA [Geminicoccus roseus]|uniref:tRNA preQ1(34) S-adenosylmethionine ribosyltransferase-isomerase QueA n=1 Tax=Geminicoccus roseus TaxID=404900 RepID=UPI000410E8A1|nr:tRNA preQ1(34) S-adenosylmethionine ribosyltransferase-isomerase QueA [Geminicoccus roseus]